MNVKTLAALRGSIRKWERIVAGTGDDEGERNCPLCKMFLDEDDTCDGCPVKEATGKHLCDETPYFEFIRLSALDGIDGDLCFSAESPEAKDAALAELEFLKSLLPKRGRR